MKHTEAQCRADAAREAAAGDPDQCVGPFATELTAEQVCNIGFAVLRRYDDDKLWRALTYETGPYDMTMANRPLQELGAAFYAAGSVDAATRSAGHLRKAIKAEAEVARLRVKLAACMASRDALRDWAQECRNQVLYLLAQQDNELGRVADGLGQSSVGLLGNNES